MEVRQRRGGGVLFVLQIVNPTKLDSRFLFETSPGYYTIAVPDVGFKSSGCHLMEKASRGRTPAQADLSGAR